MTNTYYVSKDELRNFELSYIDIIFNNGENISVDKSEVNVKEMAFADKLALNPKDFRPSPLVYKGEIIITPKNDVRICYMHDNLVNDKKQFIKNRKDYIFNLVNNIGVYSVNVYDEDWKCFNYVGNLKATTKDGSLYLVWSKPYPNCTCVSPNIEFDFNSIKKSNIALLRLNDTAEFSGHEVIDMQLNFNKELSSWRRPYFERVLDSGYLIIKPDKSMCIKPNIDLICNNNNKIYVHEIRYLYISYDDYYDAFSKECIQLPELNNNDDPLVKKYYEGAAEAGQYGFVGGYSKKLKDGTILITFGKNSKQTIEKLIKDKR